MSSVVSGIETLPLNGPLFLNQNNIPEGNRLGDFPDSNEHNYIEKLLGIPLRKRLGFVLDHLSISGRIVLGPFEYMDVFEKDSLLRAWRRSVGIPDYYHRSYTPVETPTYTLVEPKDFLSRPICLSLSGNAFVNRWSDNRVEPSPEAAAKIVDIDFHNRVSVNNWGDTRHVYNYIVTLDGGELGHVPLSMAPSLAERLFDLKLTSGMRIVANGRTFPLFLKGKENLKTIAFGFDWSLEGLYHLKETLDLHQPENLDAAILQSQAHSAKLGKIDLKGIAKAYNEVWPIIEPLMTSRPLAVCAFRSFAKRAAKTVNGVKISVIFNSKFGDGGVQTPAQFLNAIAPYEAQGDIDDETLKSEPIFREKRKQSLKGQTDRAFHKLMEDFDFLDMDEKKYPRLYRELTEGNIPLGIFFRKKESYFLLNDHFATWEVMLRLHREVTCEIAQSVAKRSTYEKDLLSYFFFVLYDLPEYLKKQTGDKWTCIPRLVDSPNDLEMNDEDDEGRETEQGQKITKKRSALTPIVDNEKKTVTVPFCSFRISGRQTQYCYSHTYHVLKRGFHFKGNTVMKDVEEKLNGRDDYGLMFYTLTGSETARGYPTFLIIFEKRKDGKETFVHFHRTHPCRSKDGDMNPIHNLTRVCYNWMAGNVRADRIKAQQGDLIFAETDKAPDTFVEQVRYYDNHQFSEPVWFAPYTKANKSSNVLGYVKVDGVMVLNHHEHECVQVPPGIYEARQARSWEANPRGIWTLRID